MFRVLFLAALAWPLTACHGNTPPVPRAQSSTAGQSPSALPGEPVTSGLDRTSLAQLFQAQLEERYQHPAEASQRYLDQARHYRNRELAQYAWRAAQQTNNGHLTLEAVTLWRTLFDHEAADKSFTATPDDIALMHALCDQAMQAQHWSEALHWQLALDRYGDHDAIDSMLETWMAPEQPMPREALRAQVLTHLQQHPEHTAALIVCAALLAGEERYQETFQRLNSILQRHPDNVDALFAKALVEQRLGHLAAALKTVHTALSHGAQHEYRFALLRIDLELDLPRPTLADQHINQFVGQLPASAHAIDQLAQFLLDHHHVDAAQRLISHHPLTEQEAHNANIETNRQALQGVTADQLNNVEEALTAFYGVTPSSSLFAHAQLRLLTLTQEHKGNDAAVLLMRHQRERFPDQLLLLTQLELSALQQAHQPEQAYALLEQSVDAHPEHDGLRYLRAMQRITQGHYPEALSDLKQLAERQPGNAIFLNAYGYMLADQQHDYAQALPLLRKAIALAPDNAEIQDSLGWTLYGMKRYDEARQWLAHAYSALPTLDVARHYLYVLIAQNDMALAEQTLHHLYESSTLTPAMRAQLSQQFPMRHEQAK